MQWLSVQVIKSGLPSAAKAALAGLMAFWLLAPTVHGDTLVQSFKSKDTLEPGWVVALTEDDNNSVEPAPAGDTSRMYGVVIDPSQVPFTIQRQENNQVYVATTGTYPVFVSTQYGEINPGDFISMSSTDGIAAKAVSRQSYVLGKAVEKFNGKDGVITRSSDGSAIGRINVTIIPGKNPLTKNDVAVPSALKTLGDGIAGRDTAAIRIYTALAVFLMTSIVSAVVLWVGIRGGMIAIGRNPLSRSYIIRGLIQVIIISILIFVVGVIGVYLLLKL